MTMTGFKDYTKPVNDQMRTVSNVEPLPVTLGGGGNVGAVWGPDAQGSVPTRPPIAISGIANSGSPAVQPNGSVINAWYGIRGSAASFLTNVGGSSFANVAAPVDNLGAQQALYTNSQNFIAAGSNLWSYSRSILYANNTQAVGVQATDMPLWSTSDLLGNVVNLTLGGDNTVIAGVGGQTIRVHRLYLSSLLANDIIIKDGAGTALTGTIHLNPGEVFMLDFSGRPWFKTSVGNAFIIYSAVVTTVGGRVEYAQSA